MKKYKFLIIFFCLILIIIFLEKKYFLNSSSLSKNIEKNDKKTLSDFFKHYVINDSWGYVFIGSKPMSLSSINIQIDKQNNGWVICKKYKSLFENNFIFLEKQNKFHSNLIDVLVINKKEFLKIVQENKEKCNFFKSFDETVFALLDNDELLGIFLGYGKENAKKFCLYNLNNNNNNEKKLNLFIDKIDFFKLFFKNFGLFKKNIYFMILPSFMADLTSSETKNLKKKYKKARKAIISHYKNKDFLEATLELLCENKFLDW